MQGRFQPGDHLHVRRRLGYYRHGIYISDDRVIQFGGGVTLQNKVVMANMCASGSWTESYQVRRWFGRKAAADAVLLFWLAARSRTERSLPRAANVAIVASVAVGMAAIGTYNSQIGKFWREIRGDWEAHERILDEDPRNGAPA